MKNAICLTAIGMLMFLASCQNNSGSVGDPKSNIERSQFVGSWVQPNPINDKEIQGYVFNSDGTAQSINMATLNCRKWWIESDKLVLVLESIGNRVSGIDTIRYDVLLITEKELKLRNGDYTDEYRRK